ncbi:MAG: tRNA pseudouridine(13) synthase TruD [Magnetococcales bacterium]|nr:tRNA pseudouridine(13) synthase TruD [Magnetococcales bacterium]
MSNRNLVPDAKNAAIQPELPLATPGAGLAGEWKRDPADFQVTELRRDPPDGAGEHWVLTIEKIDLTTEMVAQWLARTFDRPLAAVGYAGLKDRWATTVQQFSIHVPGTAPLPDLATTVLPGLRILDAQRHQRKIRVGHLVGNRFRIRLRDCHSTPTHRQEAERVADALRHHGIPNWFGPQRFGRQEDNAAGGRLVLAGQLREKNRHRRGLLLSAVRSELFNRVLAERMHRGWFQRLLDGDVAQLEGRSACFSVSEAVVEQERFLRGDIHPTGPLFGSGLLRPEGEPGALEREVATLDAETVQALEQFGMKGDRRALRVIPKDLELTWEGGDLLLGFTLPKGTFATSLLREFLHPLPLREETAAE